MLESHLGAPDETRASLYYILISRYSRYMLFDEII